MSCDVLVICLEDLGRAPGKGKGRPALHPCPSAPLISIAGQRKSDLRKTLPTAALRISRHAPFSYVRHAKRHTIHNVYQTVYSGGNRVILCTLIVQHGMPGRLGDGFGGIANSH